LNGRARGRSSGIDDGVAGRAYRGEVCDVENEEGQLHHIAEAGARRRQASAQVLEHLPGPRLGIPGPDLLTTLVLGDMPAHHHRPTAAADHLAVTTSGSYPLRSHHVP